ncbi:Hypothetical_protein [Hexamita inflata]|uniref:Hypothetical_protein n=1 Tax=Hexamita inflata TaxID=28002 RepID=A0AA86QL66_9EUKA|nr:Hypothetical protein HINF_LOCUS47908 [Hexamita inflata]
MNFPVREKIDVYVYSTPSRPPTRIVTNFIARTQKPKSAPLQKQRLNHSPSSSRLETMVTDKTPKRNYQVPHGLNYTDPGRFDLQKVSEDLILNAVVHIKNIKQEIVRQQYTNYQRRNPYVEKQSKQVDYDLKSVRIQKELDAVLERRNQGPGVEHKYIRPRLVQQNGKGLKINITEREQNEQDIEKEVKSQTQRTQSAPKYILREQQKQENTQTSIRRKTPNLHNTINETFTRPVTQLFNPEQEKFNESIIKQKQKVHVETPQMKIQRLRQNEHKQISLKLNEGLKCQPIQAVQVAHVISLDEIRKHAQERRKWNAQQAME